MEDKELKQQLRIAEIVNGRAAMLGIIAALGAYLVTGQIIPGIL
ncbi:high light inducible protein [Synechococcus phage S-CBP42]|uniref:High light inducible protein n=1 Tax=Synechococcus phage S-CBP42 TaxID=461711 RepID=A0A096VKW6_9CAUD|nr:high light inducible protein [Synechococcus phage S-CBP42]AGK86672.1 high light inducible protein [Synechococcus phage S-CBP42]